MKIWIAGIIMALSGAICFAQQTGGGGGVPGGGSSVTAVTATSPIQSTGGTAPVISCPTCSTSSLPSGTQGQPLVNTTGSTAYATSGVFVDASQFSGADIGAKVNAAFAACPGADNCKVVIPSGTYTFSTQITVPQYSVLACNGSDVGLTYTGTGTAIALSSIGGEVHDCRIDMGSGAGSIGIDMSGGSNLVENVTFYNGSTTSTLISDHSDKNLVTGLKVLGTPATVVSCHNATDSEFSNLVTYGNVSNTTSKILVIDSACNGTLISDWTGSYSGLHGLLVQNTLTGGAPQWLFAKGFVSDFCTGGDCWDFDSSLSGSYLGFTLDNSWAAAAGLNSSSTVVTSTANNVHISGGKGIWITGGSKIRAAAANGILIDGANVGYVTVDSSEVAANNISAGSYNGITVSAMSYYGGPGYGGLTITNNTIGNLYGENSSGAQVYGIAFTQANATDVVITGNNLDYNSTGPIQNSISSSANYTIYNNQPQSANTGTITSSIIDKAGQVNNVLAYGAVTGTTDNKTAFNAAIAACPSSTCTVYVPPGTYAIKTSGFTINQPNVNLQCAPGAIIQAQTGFPSTYPILNINGSAKNVVVSNCLWDGNSLSAEDIAVATTAANITIDHNEFKGSTLHGIFGSLRTSGPLRITNNYIHNLGSGAVGFYDLAGSGGSPTVNLDGNWFDSLTAQGAGASGDSNFEASGNKFSSVNSGVAEGSLYGYGLDRADWQHNYFYGDGVAVHCDTCAGGNISFNTSFNSNGAMADYFVEASSNMTIEGNNSTNDTASGGITLGSGSLSVGPANYRQQVFSFDSTTGYTAGTNVTLTTDNSDKKEGTGSMVATANSSFTTGTLWYYNFATPQLNVWGYQDMWVKETAGGFLNGTLSLVCSINTNLSTQDMVVPIPPPVSGTWYRMIQYQPGWQGALAQNSGGTGFKSCGVVVNISDPSIAVKFDDYDYAAEVVGNKIVNNSVILPLYTGIAVGGGQNTIVSKNYVEGAGHIYGNSGAYQFANSPGTVFTDNTANFMAGAYESIGIATNDSVVQSTTTVTNFTTSNATTLYSTPADIFAGGGANFSVSGCGTATSLVGNGLVGTFHAASTTCAPVVTTGLTAPHGYVCDMGDRTTTADFTTKYNTSDSTTTATWPSQTVVSGDVMAFKCSAY